jgi:hypothetical protein
MSNVKASFEANLEEMKKTVPQEFWADLDKQVAAAAPVAVPTEAEQVAAVTAELKANPAVDDAAVAAEIPSSITVPAASAAPSQADQDAAIAVAAKATEASIAGGGTVGDA